MRHAGRAATNTGQTDRQTRHKADRSAAGWRAGVSHAASNVVLSAVLIGIGALVPDEEMFIAGATVFALAWIGVSHGFIDRRRSVERWMTLDVPSLMNPVVVPA